MKKVKLGDLCEIQSGGTPSRSKPEFWVEGNIPWVKIKDINSKYVDKVEEHITELGLQCSSAKLFSRETILYTIFATIGEVAILDIDAATNQAIAGLYLKSEKVLKDYLYYFLISIKNIVKNDSRGVAQNNINLTYLKNIDVPIVEIAHQQEICDNLSTINQIITQRNKQLIELSNLVKSRFNEMFIQRDFPLKRLGELVEEVRYGTSLPATLNGKYGYLRMNNITEDGQLNIQNLKHIDVPEKDLEKYVVRNGDVLFNRTNSIELVGKTCIYELDFDMVIAGYIIRIRTKKDILNPRYLSEFLNFPSTKEFLRNVAKGAVNQANINAKELQDISIPLSPLSLQNEFANFVAQVDKSQLAIQKSLEELETLKKSLMQEYFG